MLPSCPLSLAGYAGKEVDKVLSIDGSDGDDDLAFAGLNASGVGGWSLYGIIDGRTILLTGCGGGTCDIA